MKEFRFALKQTFPIFFTYLFIGIAYGVMMSDAGYSILTTVLSSVFVYAGSLQIFTVGLLTQGAPLPTVALMSFFINARHIFYGVGFIDKFRKMGKAFPYMVLTLTDETYSILCSVTYDRGIDEKKADLFISALDHSYWIFGSFLGAFAGQVLPVDLSGIDFSATALFLVVVINQWHSMGTKFPALTGLISSLFFYLLLGPDNFLIPTLCLTLFVLILYEKRYYALLPQGDQSHS